MAGSARSKHGFGKKLKDQQVTNKELYNVAGGVPTQASSSVVSGGSQGGGTYQNVQGADIYMNTYDIVDVDRLKFAAKEGAGDALTADDYGMEAIFTGGNAYGLQIRYPAGASQIFQLSKGADALINISDAFGMLLTTDLVLDDSTLTIGNVSSPSSPSATFRKIFVDEDNSDHLTVKKSDGTEIDLEAGGWTGSATSDLDMQTYDIIDVDRLQFTSDTGAGRDNTKVEMYANANTPEDAIINFPDSAVFRWTQNGTFFVAVDEDGIVPRLDDDWSIGTASYQLKDLQTKLWTADQGTIKQYLTMSNTGAGGDHYAYVVGQMTSSGNAGASLGSSTVYGDDYNHYWLRTSTRILDLQSGQSTAPSHAGEFRLDGTDVKVYTGGGVKNLSDIGSGGGGWVGTATSNLDMDSYSITDATNISGSGYLSIGSISAVASFYCGGANTFGDNASDAINFYGKTDWKNNTGSSGASSAGTYNGNILSPDGYITIKVSGTDKTIPYYST